MTYQENLQNILSGSYQMHVGAYDWGTGTDWIIITFDATISDISKNDIIITETKQTTIWDGKEFPIEVISNQRKIEAAYLCDRDGNRTKQPSCRTLVKLRVSPTEGSPFLFSMKTWKNSWSNPYFLDIQLAKGATIKHNGEIVKALSISPTATKITTAGEIFKPGRFNSFEGAAYDYVAFEPDCEFDTLVVWLHGLGEGAIEGSDPYFPILGNKAVALADSDFQRIVGPAAILAPQCPTMWMDGGSGKETSDGSSKYTSSLFALIDHYRETVQADKVVLAGCSNGGYMTLEMLRNYPDYFSCAVPVCAAMMDEWLSNDDIAKLKNQPMFFIYSHDDPIVSPEKYEAPIITRLQKAGAEELKVFTTRNVIDTTNKYHDANGAPYRFNGHWSWIYFHNNTALDPVSGQNVWSWIATRLNSH